MALDVIAFGMSDVGMVRDRNEDAFRVEPEAGLAVVADGMGGAPAGDLASSIAVERLVESLMSAPPADSSGHSEELERRMDRAVRDANEVVISEGERDLSRRGMGCTLTALLIDRESGRYALAHVGDSRAYLLRNGSARLLTRDHTLAQESIDQGQMSPEAGRDHPYGHILTRVVGMDHGLVPQLLAGKATPGDTFVLCTDGLVRVILEEDLTRMVAEGVDRLEETARRIVDLANERGGPDNSTLVILRLK